MKRIALSLFVFSVIISGAVIAGGEDVDSAPSELSGSTLLVQPSEKIILDTTAENLVDADMDFGHHHKHGRLELLAERFQEKFADLSDRAGRFLVDGFDKTAGAIKPGVLEGNNRAKIAIALAATTVVSAAVIYTLVSVWKKYTAKAKSQEEQEEEAAKVLLCRAAAVAR